MLDFPNYCSDSWRKYNLKGFRWCVDGDVGSLFGLGTGDRMKLCMVLCHSFYTYGTWRRKKVGKKGREGFKIITRGANHKRLGRPIFLGGR